MPSFHVRTITPGDWALGFAASFALALVCYLIFGDYIASTAITIGGAPVFAEQWSVEREHAARRRAAEAPPPLPYPWNEADR